MFSSTTFRRVATLLALTRLCFSALGSTEECFFDPFRPEPPAGMRSNIFSNPVAAYVAAYPSVGGVVMANPGPIEMQHLNLISTSPELTTRPAPAARTTWPCFSCNSGPAGDPTGARTRGTRRPFDDGVEYRHHFPPRLEVAYPSSGGVWVAKYSPDKPQVRLLEEEERRE